MTSEDIKQMFLDAAALKKMPVFAKEYPETEKRFADLHARYMTEYVPGSSRPEKKTEKPQEPETPAWKEALMYLQNVFRQMDMLAPDMAESNRAAWAIIAPAVQKAYAGSEKPEDANA